MNYDVKLDHPQPNSMFSDWQRAITIFLTYAKPVKCAYCGRSSKHLWTQLKFFRIAEGFEEKLANGKVVEGKGFELHDGKELFPPLTPVCRKHVLSPEGHEPEKPSPTREGSG